LTIEIGPLAYLGIVFISVVIGMKFGPKFVNWAIQCAYQEEWSNEMIKKMYRPPSKSKKVKK